MSNVPATFVINTHDTGLTRSVAHKPRPALEFRLRWRAIQCDDIHTALAVDLHHAALDEPAPRHFKPVCASDHIAFGERSYRQFDWTWSKLIPQARLYMGELGPAADRQGAMLARTPTPR